MLDTAHVCGKNRVPVDPQKVNMYFSLETQNGGSFGPCSIKSEKTNIIHERLVSMLS